MPLRPIFRDRGRRRGGGLYGHIYTVTRSSDLYHCQSHTLQRKEVPEPTDSRASWMQLTLLLNFRDGLIPSTLPTPPRPLVSRPLHLLPRAPSAATSRTLPASSIVEINFNALKILTLKGG
jgi:hypothetical protein